MKSLKLLQTLFDDIVRQMPEHNASLHRDLITIEKRFEHEGFSFLAKTLPQICDAAFAGLESGCFSCPTSFASWQALPRLLGGLLETVFERSTGFLKPSYSIEALKELRQICYFFKKAATDAKNTEKLDKVAKASFEHCDNDITFSGDRDRIKAISRCLWRPISYADWAHITPRNGPGGVAESWKSNAKYAKVISLLPGHVASTFGWSFLETIHSKTPDDDAKLDRESRLHSVPKNSTSRRTITIEPGLLMFIQQAWNGIVRHKIERSPLSAALTLDDQEPSRRGALEASITRAFTTVDLSSASDRLSNELVQLVFAHDPILLDGLQQCRSHTCEIDGRTISLNKYAGMGNATTFPVQSIAFAVLSVDAILKTQGKTLSPRNVKRAIKLVRVFGDDIILPTYAYGALIGTLESCGLRVNMKKSFSSSGFREACGLDALDGVEITPTYMRSLPENLPDPNSLVSLISTSNQLWSKCYYRTAELIKHYVEEYLGKLPLVRPTSALLGWNDRYDSYSVGRWNRHIQAFETRSYRVRERTRKDEIDGYSALLKFFLEPGSPKRDFKTSVRRYSIKLAKGWSSTL